MTEQISPTAAADEVAAGALLLDVREDNEFAAGRSADARHIPLMTLPDALDQLDRSRVIVCVCRSGGRSGRAADFLNEQGFTAKNLEGGMQAWHSDGLPMIADDGDPIVA
jgi:rhodanese-related sulfurtransferase